MRRRLQLALSTAAALALAGPDAQAQPSTADGIAQYRALLADGNPAELWEAKGEALWKQKRGAKNVAFSDTCDLGKGTGVVKGAFVELPRYFADTRRVQDLESRLLSCMEAQGYNAAEIAATPFGRGEQVNLEALVAYVSAMMTLPSELIIFSSAKIWKSGTRSSAPGTNWEQSSASMKPRLILKSKRARAYPPARATRVVITRVATAMSTLFWK